MTVLSPGMYFIEMAFDREVELPTLTSALAKMGFASVVFDQSLSEPSTGLISKSPVSLAAASPASRVASPVLASPTRPSPLAVVKQMTPAPAPAPAPVRKQEVAATPAGLPPVALAASVPTPAPIPSRSQEAQATPAGPPPVALAAALPPPKPIASPDKDQREGLISRLSTSAPTLGPTATTAPTKTQETPESPKLERNFTPSSSSSNEEMEPTEEVQAEQEAAAPPPEPVKAPPEVVRESRIKELWQRWVEWGSPFATGETSTSGENEPLIRVRFFAQLTRPITIQNRPHMTWLVAHRMRSNPLSDLKLKGHPWELRQGQTYEFRFLAREKSAPTRDAVRAGLIAMGFAPMKLLAIKKNMRLPRRPTSVALWYGLGQWAKPDSLVTRDDPFFFEEVKEVR